MHYMNDGLEVSLINQTFHGRLWLVFMLKQTVHWASGYVAAGHRCKYGENHIKSRLKITAEHQASYCCALVEFESILFVFAVLEKPKYSHMCVILLALVLVCSFLDSQPRKFAFLRMVFLFCFLLLRAGSFPFAGKNLHFSILMWNCCTRATEKRCACACVCLSETASAGIFILTLPVQMGAAWSGVSCFQLGRHVQFSS